MCFRQTALLSPEHTWESLSQVPKFNERVCSLPAFMVSKCPFIMSNKTKKKKKNHRKMLNFLRHGKKGKQLIHFPYAASFFFFFLAVPFSYFKRLSPVSLWLKIMKNFCPEGFSLKTLKLQSIVPAVWGFWSWITSRGEEWEREGQHFCLGHKATFKPRSYLFVTAALIWH